MSIYLIYILIAIVAALLVYFVMKASHTPRRSWEATKDLLNKTEAENTALQRLIEQFQAREKDLLARYEALSHSREQLLVERAELDTLNKNLEDTLEQHKIEVNRLQEQAKEQFENLANRILEEKSHKFTTPTKKTSSVF